MNNRETGRKLDYKQMQELLPDYVFGRIDGNEKSIFEENLPQFPDLQDEIGQVREVFTKVEAMNIDKIIDAKTRNLSIRVKERMNNRRKASTYSLAMKYAVPTVAVLFLGVYMYINKDNMVRDIKGTNIIQYENRQNTQDTKLLSKADAEMIFADEINLEDINHIYSDINLASNYNDITSVIAEGDKTIDNIYYEQLSNQFKDLKTNDFNSFYKDNSNSMNSIYNELDNMDESQIQSLIEDIKNVRI